MGSCMRQPLLQAHVCIVAALLGSDSVTVLVGMVVDCAAVGHVVQGNFGERLVQCQCSIQLSRIGKSDTAVHRKGLEARVFRQTLGQSHYPHPHPRILLGRSMRPSKQHIQMGQRRGVVLQKTLQSQRSLSDQ